VTFNPWARYIFAPPVHATFLFTQRHSMFIPVLIGICEVLQPFLTRSFCPLPTAANWLRHPPPLSRRYMNGCAFFALRRSSTRMDQLPTARTPVSDSIVFFFFFFSPGTPRFHFPISSVPCPRARPPSTCRLFSPHPARNRLCCRARRRVVRVHASR